MISSERNFLHKMIFNKLRIFGVIFACVFTLHGFADEECENEQYNINNECKYCNAGYCVDDDNDNDNDECVACPAGYKCPKTDGNLSCSTVKAENSEYICPVNTYSDAGKTSCTSCGIGYTTGNSGPIGDGLCLKIKDESGLGYGCTSSRACQMVTPQLCHGRCSCDISQELRDAAGSEAAMTRLKNCGVTEIIASCLLGKSEGKCTIGKLEVQRNIVLNAFVHNQKSVRCFCNKSFVLGDNVTVEKTYSDVVYPDNTKRTGAIVVNPRLW